MNKAVHWKDYKWDAERWPNFSPQELACKGTGLLLLDHAALDRLQALRTRLGRPLLITSAYRSPEHNRRVGGARNSKHMQGIAFDVRQENQDPAEFIAAALAVGFTAVGTYPKSGFIHIDTRPGGARWGDPFPRSATGLATQPERTITQSRTIQGASVAGIGTLGSVVAEQAETLMPLAGMSDMVKWAFLALTLAGVALTIYARLDDWKDGRR